MMRTFKLWRKSPVPKSAIRNPQLAMPKASTSRPREVVNGVKRFSAGLSDQAIIDASVGLFIIVALSMLLLRNYQRPLIPQLAAGSVATADIITPEDVKIEDAAETRRVRDQATVVSDLSSMNDKLTASASLRSEKLVWPADYEPRERKLMGEILGSLVVPNVEYNEGLTQRRREDAREQIKPVVIAAKKGEAIVARNETVSPAKALLLAEAARTRPIGQRALEFGGTVIIVTMITLVLWQYLVRYQRQHLRVRRHFLLQIACFIITMGLARVFFAVAAAMSSWATTAPFNSPIAYKYLAPLAV